MSTRFGVGPLLVVVSLMLVTTVTACLPSAGNEDNPSGWRGFLVVPGSNPPVPWPTPVPIGSIAEMERVAGFTFVFPSYLPEGMGNTIMLDASEGASVTENGVVTKVGPEEEVGIPRKDQAAPSITIEEQAKPFPADFPDSSESVEYVTVAETEVGCKASPAPNGDELNPVLKCDWLVGDRGFRVFFQWTVKQAIPGYVTEDMRQEALKVVESMIVAPEHP
jgi:hypothetical protein